MSDQCKHCLVRGKIKACKETPCSHHENWYAVEQQKKIDALTGALQHAQSDINWMINERTFLNQFVFDYIDEVLKES